MSHFTEVVTKLTDLDRVLRAVKRRGFTVLTEDNAPLLAQGFMGNQIESLAVIKTDTIYDIGVQRDAVGNLQFVADWELLGKVKGIDARRFAQEVQQEYALITVEELVEAQGLSITEAHRGADGSLELTVSEW